MTENNSDSDYTGGISGDRILTHAERECGAYGLSDEGLRSRLASIVNWVNERGPYSADRIQIMEDQIQRLLANRLKIQFDRQRFSETAREEIVRSIFIIGFPRAGTSFLDSLIAEDPAMQKPMSWHMHSPSPPPGAGPVVSERIAFAQRPVEAWMDFCAAQDRCIHTSIMARTSFAKMRKSSRWICATLIATTSTRCRR